MDCPWSYSRKETCCHRESDVQLLYIRGKPSSRMHDQPRGEHHHGRPHQHHPTSPPALAPAPTTTMAAATTWRILQFATTVRTYHSSKLQNPLSNQFQQNPITQIKWNVIPYVSRHRNAPLQPELSSGLPHAKEFWMGTELLVLLEEKSPSNL